MLKKASWAMTALLVMASYSYAAEGEAKKSFTLDVDYAAAVEWANSPAAEALSTRDGRLEIIEKKGDTVKLKARTLKGVMIFTIRESITQSKDAWYYESKLVSCEQGGITFQIIKVTISKKTDSTVQVDMYAKVTLDDSLGITDLQLKFDLRRNFARAQRTLEREIEKNK
jgi:hypothetical protein